MENDGTPGKKLPAPSVGERTASFTLILRKTSAQARIAGWNPDIWGEEDYWILDGDRDVGRIYQELIHGERNGCGSSRRSQRRR
jgi:hypothetical protein